MPRIQFPIAVGKNLEVVLDQDIPDDPDGIILLRLLDKKGVRLKDIPILPDDVPLLTKALIDAAFELNDLGMAAYAYRVRH